MNFPNLTNSGLQGIHNGMDQMRDGAHHIASSVAKGGEDTKELANAMMDLNQGQHQVEASVKVVQAVDEAIGSLLNVVA